MTEDEAMETKWCPVRAAGWLEFGQRSGPLFGL